MTSSAACHMHLNSRLPAATAMIMMQRSNSASQPRSQQLVNTHASSLESPWLQHRACIASIRSAIAIAAPPTTVRACMWQTFAPWCLCLDAMVHQRGSKPFNYLRYLHESVLSLRGTEFDALHARSSRVECSTESPLTVA